MKRLKLDPLNLTDLNARYPSEMPEASHQGDCFPKPEIYRLPRWAENIEHWFWSMFCRPELWILIAASLALYFGMTYIGANAEGASQ